MFRTRWTRSVLTTIEMHCAFGRKTAVRSLFGIPVKYGQTIFQLSCNSFKKVTYPAYGRQLGLRFLYIAVSDGLSRHTTKSRIKSMRG